MCMCAWSRRERVCVHEHVHERARERVPMLGPQSHLYSPRSTSHSHGPCMRSVLARTCCLDRCSLITHVCARPSQSLVPACIARVPCVYLCVRSRVCSHAGQLACVPSCACEVMCGARLCMLSVRACVVLRIAKYSCVGTYVFSAGSQPAAIENHTVKCHSWIFFV